MAGKRKKVYKERDIMETIQGIENEKLPIKFDIDTLNLIISYIFSDSKAVTRSSMSNIHRLFNKIDERLYEADDRIHARYQFIKRAVYAKLELNMVQPKIILNYCKNDSKYEDIIENEIKSECEFILNGNEMSYVKDMLSDKLSYAYIYLFKDSFYEIFDKMETGDYDNLKEMSRNFKKIAKTFLNYIRKTENVETGDLTFSLAEENFKSVVTEVVNKLSNPTNILRTGIQKLNEILNGGFESGRVYLFLGLSGQFKSGLLLSVCKWIKAFNAPYIPKDPSKTPCVLYLTFENSVAESVARLFNMTSSNDDITKFKPEEVIELMKSSGLRLGPNNNIDLIMKYVPNKTIDTSDLYNIIDDLEDDGYEVIALVQDYVKRIRAVNHSQEVRFELANVIDEFKVLAQDKDIPIITASQLNRDASKTVDAAVEAKKTDMTRFLGRSNVGESWGYRKISLARG